MYKGGGTKNEDYLSMLFGSVLLKLARASGQNNVKGHTG